MVDAFAFQGLYIDHNLDHKDCFEHENIDHNIDHKDSTTSAL
jgi:hypothetical protein